MAFVKFLSTAACLVLAGAMPISSVPASAWQALNTSTSGRLYQEFPLGVACYLKYEGAPNPHVNLAQCEQLLKNQGNLTYQQQFAGGYEYATWPMCITKSQSCNTYGELPVDPVSPLVGNCQQGNVPDYYIDANIDSAIQAGLAFAAKQNVPLVVKASGHDYKGRSAGQGALELWMFNYKPALQIQRNFVPAGASSSVGDVVTYSAGHTFDDVLSFVDQYNSTIVAATAESVHPAGGYIQAGGHSPLSPTYGLAVDNVYQINAILANGTKVTASKSQNSDLFYALRGGGGGTFAVVTEVWQRLIPNPTYGYQFASFSLYGVTDTSPEALLKVLIANAEQWSKDGWGGYAFPSFVGNHSSMVYLVTPKLTLSQAQTSMKPLTNFMQSLPNVDLHNISISTYTSYYDLWKTDLASGVATGQTSAVSLASRLVPVANFQGTQNQTQLFNAAYPISQAFGPTAKIPLFICLTTPAFATPDPNSAPSSVTPAWRNSLWHVIATNEFSPEQDLAGLTSEFKTTHDAIKPLIDITPGSGTYQNEDEVYQSDAVGAYWGQENYEKLTSIKKEYDPSNLLTCWDCVGWDSSDERYSCYVPPSNVQ